MKLLVHGHLWPGEAWEKELKHFSSAYLTAYAESLLEWSVVDSETLEPVFLPRTKDYMAVYGHRIGNAAITLMAADVIAYAKNNLTAIGFYMDHKADMDLITDRHHGWTAVGYALGRARNGLEPGFWSPDGGSVLPDQLDRAAEEMGESKLRLHKLNGRFSLLR